MSIVEVGADAPELFALESLSTASAASAPKVPEEPPEPLRGQFLLGLDKRNLCISVMMLKRWLQENDFKYLAQHFGINQLTS